MGDSCNYLSVNEVKDLLLNENYNPKRIDFFEFVNNYLKNIKVTGTAEQYYWLAESLKFFAGPILPFSEIKLNFLFRYEAFLRTRGVGNGIINFMVTFRSLFNKARELYNDEDSGKIIIPHYPFRKYKIPKRIVKSTEHILSIDELNTELATKKWTIS